MSGGILQEAKANSDISRARGVRVQAATKEIELKWWLDAENGAALLQDCSIRANLDVADSRLAV